MIAFNERLEAANLLKLLKASRRRLADFNADDGRIAAAMGVDASDAEAMSQARLAWYLRLALWAEEQRLSGRCSIVFTRTDRIQRAPYDLLACCPLTRDERETADIEAGLLVGLSAREQMRKRRLYHRLLCIQPMRRLLERLCVLAKLAREAGDDREKLLGKVNDPAWRRPIEPLEERRSGQSLTVRDNDFTILERLIANHGRRLRRNRTVVLPRKLLGLTRLPEPLLLAAMAGALDGSESRSACTQYRSIPGGHMQLDVYRTGSPEGFMKKAREDQERQAEKVVYIRPYSEHQLVQLPQKLAPDVPFKKSRLLRKAAQPLRRGVWRIPLPQNAAMAPQEADMLTDGLDWRALCSCICSLKEPEYPDGLEETVFRAADDGGKAVYGMLLKAIPAAAEAPAKKKKEAKPMDNQQCMFDFFKKGTNEPLHLARAMEELRRHMKLFFAADALPEKFSSDPVKPLSNGGDGWQLRAIKLILTYLTQDRLIAEHCEAGTIPQTVDAALTRLAQSAEERDAFHTFVGRLKAAPSTWTKITVNVRYAKVAKKRIFMCYATPLADDSALKKWVAARGAEAAGMTEEALMRACSYGLRRHLALQSGVTTPEKKGFQLKVNPTGVPKEPDLIFRLYVIRALLRLAKAENAPVGTVLQAKLTKRFDDFRKSFLAVSGNARIGFVEEGEHSRLSEAEFTPEKLPEIASLAFHWNLKITVGQGSEDDVALMRVT